MKQIKFNGKDYLIPQTWSDVTVEMLVKASELSELLPDAPVIAVMSAYTGIPVSELKTNKATEVSEILEIMTFVTEEYKPIPVSSFTLNGVEYKAEEELVNQRFEDWVALQTTLTNFEHDRVRALPYMLAILCKKENERLDDFKLEDRAKEMRKAKMTDAKDIEAFFLHSLNAYKALSIIYSTQDVQRELVLHKVQELNNTMKIRKGQTGIFSSLRFRIGIWQIQLWWVKKVLEKYFNSPHTKDSKKNWIQTCKSWLMTKRKGKKVKYHGKV